MKKRFNMLRKENNLAKVSLNFRRNNLNWLICTAMNIEAARNIIYKSAWLKDHGRKFKKEAAMAKLFASEMCMRVCDQAVQRWRI